MKLPRRRCKNPDCREWFHPPYQNHTWCSPECGVVIALARREKDRQKAIQEAERHRKDKEQQERHSLKVRKLAIKPTNYFKAQAQQAFNQFIRLRDHNQPCISCGETDPPDLFGGQWDCGHFKTVGGFPELRFEERNAYRQCKSCNGGSAKHGAKAATVAHYYESNLVRLFGQDLVDWLNGPHEMTRYRREDYIRIRDEYRRKCRELIKKQEAA
ncbi:recombination protein NinG [Erwiniaceae bacterium BAC15a-03b]|uniref:Recombination protein NinG n=1 Tax=Winslowiella arboricola TaxID=2978220 RepID=A0A9J6PXH8_9GAMM|nr:recombination protein NinG [Winslowiella arboricola]MCU5775101.1 recombination protein NinG [Winslowiella arboricola]MCU5780445.1 recombination protein NinG [Winslowiella arboricola]